MFLSKRVIIFIVLILLGIFFLTFLLRPKTQTPVSTTPIMTPQPSPSVIPSGVGNLKKQEQDYIKSAQQDAEINKTLYDQDNAVGKLVNTLPYTGTNFSLTFDYNTFDFIAVIDKDKQAEGNQELDDYLRSNGVLDRSWIKYLIIRYQ